MKKLIAAFDFDGTIYKKDSFLEFAKFALSPFWFIKGVLLAMPVIIRWKSGFIDSSKAKERLFSLFYKNLNLKDMEGKAELFADEVDKNLNQEVMGHLRHMKTKDAEIIIVSASPGFWIAPWAKRHGITTLITTEAETVDGLFTGKFSTPNCKGDEKVKRILERFPVRSDYYMEAWGDSDDDLPMLKFADVPHRVQHH